jgi:AbrB family looped-hinge helix DNA binding protein
MVRSTVAVNAQGRVTLPARVRRKLGLTEGDRLDVALEDDRIVLRPARLVVAEDAWAYRPESLDSIRRGLDDIQHGRVYQTSDTDLLAGRLPYRRKAVRATRAQR